MAVARQAIKKVINNNNKHKWTAYGEIHSNQ